MSSVHSVRLLRKDDETLLHANSLVSVYDAEYSQVE